MISAGRERHLIGNDIQFGTQSQLSDVGELAKDVGHLYEEATPAVVTRRVQRGYVGSGPWSGLGESGRKPNDGLNKERKMKEKENSRRRRIR